jgi:hypothetical protein
MAALNLNDAGPQRQFDLIPDNTIVCVQMNIRAGGAGDGGYLKRSKDGNVELLDCEFVVTDSGDYYKRKIWANLTLSGPNENHALAVDISRQTLRAIIESAFGILPNDTTEAAVKVRNDVTFAEFQGLRFIAKVGIKPGSERPGGGTYEPKNIIKQVMTPDRVEWHRVDQDPGRSAQPTPASSPGAVTPVPVTRPDWAR